MKRLRILLTSAVVVTSILTINSKDANAEWRNNSNGWWYSEESSYAVGWRQMENVWYYFDKNGYMKKGWFYDNGDWYYADSNGKMQTGIVQIDGKTYYLASSGAMQFGNITIGGEKYTFAISGEAIGDKIPKATKEFSGDGIATIPIQGIDTSKTVEIDLQGNPTTGYTWDYKIQTEDIVKEDSKQYKRNDTKPGIVGAGGIYTWKFSGLKEGTTEVTFEYYRPWEKKAIETKTYIFTVDKELKITTKEK